MILWGAFIFANKRYERFHCVLGKFSNKLNGFFELWCSFNIFGIFYANYGEQHFKDYGVWFLGVLKCFCSYTFHFVFFPRLFVNLKATKMIFLLIRAPSISVEVPDPIRHTSGYWVLWYLNRDCYLIFPKLS